MFYFVLFFWLVKMQVVHGWDLESCSESAQNFQNLFVGKICMNKMCVKTVKTRVEWINLSEVSGLKPASLLKIEFLADVLKEYNFIKKHFFWNSGNWKFWSFPRKIFDSCCWMCPFGVHCVTKYGPEITPYLDTFTQW